MVDLDLIKTIAEVSGTLLTTLSIVLMGRGGRCHRPGLYVSLSAAVPWTVFAVVTSSWLMIAQSAVVIGFNLANLRHRGCAHAS